MTFQPDNKMFLERRGEPFGHTEKPACRHKNLKTTSAQLWRIPELHETAADDVITRSTELKSQDGPDGGSGGDGWLPPAGVPCCNFKIRPFHLPEL